MNMTLPIDAPELDDDRSLRTRVCILEAALACIAREADVALGRPDISFLTLCRISSIARQSRPDDVKKARRLR
jgi:hypothetical protein